MILILFLVASATLLFIWIKWNYSYWTRRGVPGPEPGFLVGNIGPVLNFSEHWGVVTERWYKKYNDVPYIGFFKMLNPSILLRDADIIKDILIKDFQYFEKNDSNLSEKYDPLLKQSPFFNVDEEWKARRRELMPVLSASKMKSLTSVTNGAAKEMIDFIKSHKPDTDFDAKKLSVQFTTQNVIKCVFSIDSRAFSNTDESEFVKAGKMMFEPSFWTGIKFYIAQMLPAWIVEIIPLSFISAETDEFFRKLVNDNKESRKNLQSNDIFQSLMQMKEKIGSKSEIFLPGHSFTLFIEGTETSSTALCYALYELASNPHCQDKLYDEIIESLNKVDNEENIDIHSMPYLENVLLETMRMHAPLMVMQKVCTKKYELPGLKHHTKPLTIYPGTPIHIPVQAIHMDEKYYPQPNDFRPERFTGEEHQNRHKGVFLPFGEGPRICIGMRLAMTQMKFALMHIVKNYYVKLSPNHKPIRIDPQTLLSYPTDGILVQFESRA